MNSDKLKNIISKKANSNSDISQKFYQLFYFERILERISKSNYRRQIILKGELFNEVIKDLADDDNINNLWNEYISKTSYAKGVKYEDTINAIKQIIEILESQLVEV